MGHDHDHDHQGHSHDHSHGHSHAHVASGDKKTLAIIAVLTGGYMVAEIVGGYVSGSLALIADAGHMALDTVAVIFGLFAAYEKETDDFIGWFCLRPQRTGPLDVVELGYRLRRDAWGKGYATEGSSALVDKGFSELGVSTIWGETMALNVSSQRVMEKVGMSVVESIPTPEDMQGVDGAERGGLRYEITREQWERR